MPSNKLHFWLGLSPLVLGLIIAVIIGVTLNSLPAKLPLFYSVAWGEGQLATHQQLLIVPTSIAFITLLNLAISWQLHKSQSLFKLMLLFSSLIVSVILAVAFIKIILMFI